LGKTSEIYGKPHTYLKVGEKGFSPGRGVKGGRPRGEIRGKNRRGGV